MKRTSRILATFLSLALLICALPQSVLAQIGDLLNGQDTEATERVSPDVYVLGEVIDNRTETGKTFRMSDGSFIAADYGQVIHYAGEDGAWTDYDNTLTFSEALARDSEDMAGYGNTGSNLRIKLANNSNSNNLVKLTMGNYKISLHLVGANKSKALEVYPAMEDPEGNDIDSAATLHKFSAGAIYEDILPDVDLEYIISGGSVKENIIIKDTADSYTYTFELKLQGLVPEVDEEGNILLKDETTNITQLVIPAGYMFDANGAYSDAVTYSIAHKNGEKYTLTVTADANWINADERAFPVTVDPTVSSNYSTNDGHIYGAVLERDNSDTSIPIMGQTVFSVGTPSSGLSRAVLRWKNLPAIDLSIYEIKNARISLGIANATVAEDVEDFNIGIYPIISNLSATQLSSLTWDSDLQFEPTCDSYIHVEVTASHSIFDITSIAESWYLSGNNGLLLKAVDESQEHCTVTYWPEKSFMLYVEYQERQPDTNGTWDPYGGIVNTSVSINSYNGSVRLEQLDVESTGNILPVSVSHVFDIYNTETVRQIYSGKGMHFGKGWSLSILECVQELTEAEKEEEEKGFPRAYLYDCYGNKTKHSIITDNGDPTSTGFFKNADGTYRYTDSEGNIKRYNSNGLISSIEDVYGNKLHYVYINGRLTYLEVQPKDETYKTTVFRFGYNNANALSVIENLITSKSVSFEYVDQPGASANDSTASSANYLKTVTYSSKKRLFYTYNADGTVCDIYDTTNETDDTPEANRRYIYFHYTTRTYPKADNKKSVRFIGFHTSKGFPSTTSFSYYKNLTIATTNGIKLYSVFDNHGNVIQQYYANGSETFSTVNNIRNGKLLYQATADKSENFITNSDFSISSAWGTSMGVYTTTTSFCGSSRTMSITGDSTKYRYSSQRIEGSDIENNSVFLLSGWVKANNSVAVNTTPPYNSPSCGLSMVVYYEGGWSEEFRVNANAACTTWQYISTLVSLSESPAYVDHITIFCSYDFNTTDSKAYFDSVSLSPVFLTRYCYNSAGELTQMIDPSGQTITYEYNEDGQQTKSITPYGENVYEYDENKVLVKETSKKLVTTYDYDEYGYIECTTIKDKDGTYQISTSQTYDATGLTEITTTDERGKTTTYNYNGKNRLIAITDPEGNQVRYQYNVYIDATGTYRDYLTFADKDGNNALDANEQYIIIDYKDNDETQINTLNANGTHYDFTYDADNNITSIGIQGITSKLATYTYNAKNQLISKTLGNGYTETYSYDSLDNLYTVCYTDNGGTAQTLSYAYYADGNLKWIEDSAAGTREVYEYNSLGQVTQTVLYSGTSTTLTVSYTYDSKNRLRTISEVCGDYTNSYVYTYSGATDTITSVTINGHYKLSYYYDDFNRLLSQSLIHTTSSAILDNITYTYVTNGTNTTRYVATSGLANGNLTYSYTDNGYIQTVYDSTTNKQVSYQYDSLGQLTRENNPYLNATYVYTYDLAGNITSRKQYAYTTGTLGSVIDTKTYSYGTGNRLTNLNGTTISYGNAGNPNNWTGKMLIWQGSQLVNIHSSSPVDFKYDSQGLRTTKISYGSNTTTTTYFRDANGRLIREKRVSNLDQSEVNLVYQYDVSGRIIGFTYYPNSGSPSQYFFGKNAQGDVICIYDATGNTVARYNYDAWGACTIAYDNTSIGIANINPIRYRSYYYDTETGWYYLQSRYYDPAVGRFISPDDPSLLGANGDLLSYNLYAYCSNNPVNYSDPSGHSPGLIILGFVATTFIGWISSEIFGAQFAGGAFSLAGGSAAINTGVNLCYFGPIGCIAGGALITLGVLTMAFGANEIICSMTGANFIQSWTGMSADIYNDLYVALNIASSIGTIAGSIGMQIAANRILNQIVKNPTSIQNYTLKEIQVYGKYASQWNVGALKKGGHKGQGYVLRGSYDGGYIQWHPGTGNHYFGFPYWKVSSGKLGTWRGMYL